MRLVNNLSNLFILNFEYLALKMISRFDEEPPKPEDKEEDEAEEEEEEFDEQTEAG